MRIFSQIFFPFEALKTRFGTAFAERERERERERAAPTITRAYFKIFFRNINHIHSIFFTILWIFFATCLTAIFKLYAL